MKQKHLDNMENELVWEKVKEVMESSKTDYLNTIESDEDAEAPLLFNQRDLVKRINYYLNDMYTERSNDAIFWNISTTRLPHFAKLLQFDTKDFLPMGNGEMNFVQAWILRIKAKEWFKDNSFYQTLNDIAQSMASYGGTVWKEVEVDGKKTIKECKLGNLYFDQTIDKIQDTDIVEMHYLTPYDLWDKVDVWSNVLDVITKEEKNMRIPVWEFTGYVIEEDQPVYKHVIGYGYGDTYTELWCDEIEKEDCPYESFRLGRYNGRFLGIGVVERLFKLQERANELVNQNAETTKIASLLLFRTAEADMTGNVLEQAENGQIVPDATFEQVGITNTGLNMFLQELQLINMQADKLCMTPEIIQGEASPSNTTFRGIAVVNAAAVNAFTIYRQNLGEKISAILMKRIFPDVVKKWNREEFVEIAEDDVDVEVYDKALQQNMERERLLGGEVITDVLVDEIANAIAEKTPTIGRKIEMGKNFFNFEFGFKLMPTTETGDKSVMNDAYWNALQIQGANPAQLDTPLYRQYLENNGISFWKLTPKQKEQLVEAQQQGGSLPEQKKPDELLAQAQQQQV
jgi:hypothetical protein